MLCVTIGGRLDRYIKATKLNKNKHQQNKELQQQSSIELSSMTVQITSRISKVCLHKVSNICLINYIK